MVLKVIRVFLNLGSACNYSCPHCFCLAYPHEKERKEEACLEIIRKLAIRGLFKATFAGGEPLLYRDLLYACLNECQENGIFSTLLSNLTLLTNNDIAFFSSLKNFLVHSTFPSVNNETFKLMTGVELTKAKRNVVSLVKAGILFSPNIVVSTLNLKELEDIAKFLAESGIKNWMISPAVAVSGARVGADYTVLKNKVNFQCGITRYALA